jgi:FixJ family two-component response regulator
LELTALRGPVYDAIEDGPKPGDVAKALVVGVDDDHRVRESLARLAKSAGYDPRMFPSAESVLESGALAEAACLISDIRMPGIGGLELQRRVKDAYPKLPVILISAHVDEEVRSRALCEGAREFLYKPFDGEELLRAIQRAIENPIP